MLVPRFRLLFWLGIVFLPFSVVAAIVPWAAVSAIGAAATLIILAGLDATLSKGRLAGILITLPEVVRLSKGREGELELGIENEGLKVRHLRLGLALPEGIVSSTPELLAPLPTASTFTSVLWPFTALKQGRYFLDKCYLEAPSILGFWSLRAVAPTQAEIRVYPNLFQERKKLTALFMHRGIGIHSRRQVGKGREFEQLREYLLGDSYEDIHWKATAKRHQPITKIFQIERTQQVYVVMDASRLSARETDQRPHLQSPAKGRRESGIFTTGLERFATAALVMALATESQGDLFGLITFDDRVRTFLRAQSGKAHFDGCRDALYTLQPQSVSPDFGELFAFIGTNIRRRALLVILTNLDDPVLAESFTRHIGIIRRRHLVVVNMLKPPEARPLFSSSPPSSLDAIYQNLGGHLIWRHLREVEKVLHRQGIEFSLLEEENMCTELVSKYLAFKRRQAL
ncbi:MAG: DUF58 domain-containing protein [Desulfobacterales bacterium]|nr:MAG: DUF58 domain-containing protein [Desulfobacterales bacterium]